MLKKNSPLFPRSQPTIYTNLVEVISSYHRPSDGYPHPKPFFFLRFFWRFVTGFLMGHATVPALSHLLICYTLASAFFSLALAYTKDAKRPKHDFCTGKEAEKKKSFNGLYTKAGSRRKKRGKRKSWITFIVRLLGEYAVETILDLFGYDATNIIVSNSIVLWIDYFQFKRIKFNRNASVDVTPRASLVSNATSVGVSWCCMLRLVVISCRHLLTIGYLFLFFIKSHCFHKLLKCHLIFTLSYVKLIILIESVTFYMWFIKK